MKIFTLFFLFLFFPAALASEMSAAQIDDRIVFVGKLISSSSAFKQIEASGNPHAVRLKDDAARHYEEAIAAREAGDLAAASDSLARAVSVMYAAVDATKNSEATQDKEKRDFDNRAASTEALISAHKAIATEKGLEAQHRQLESMVAAHVAEANELRSAGQADEAWVRINEAYELVRDAVERLRQGETLVRELKFETEEDEYIYELDRNDTHAMLFELLLKEKAPSQDQSDRARAHREASAELRLEAERLATEGEFKDAIEVLERSTRELVKAIRGAGVYIPG